MGAMFKNLTILLAAATICGCKTAFTTRPQTFSHFVGCQNFSDYKCSQSNQGETVLLSPKIQAGMQWNELIVSWNADAPAGTYLKIEARAVSPAHVTKFYTLGIWSPDNQARLRTSVRNQQDGDGTVDTDTLVLAQGADAAQIRVTLGGTNGALPRLKFLGACFANTRALPAVAPARPAAWGEIIATPERSQFGEPSAKGWCSPSSLSMVLARWSESLSRPEMNLTVAEVAAKVYDPGFKGTGNWPFNTALAGSFSGMRSFVTRFNDLSDVEAWMEAGVPVILSTRWDWLQPDRPFAPEGHLIVCIGFTKTGDVVVNDPAAHLDRGQSVRQVYRRADVIHAWTKSHNAVYLVYPEAWRPPADRYGHW